MNEEEYTIEELKTQEDEKLKGKESGKHKWTKFENNDRWYR